jgi:hypothetical protein
MNGSDMKGLGRFYGATMGIDCPPGQQVTNIFGMDVCTPSLDSLATMAEGQIAAGIASTPAVQAGATSAAKSAAATSLINFYNTHTMLVWGIAIAVVVGGTYLFMNQRKAA